MKNSIASKARKTVILFAMMFGAMVTAFAQQEVDPTWFDPWAPPAPTAAAQAKSKVVSRKNREKATSTSTAQKTAKVHSKRNATQARTS